MTHTLRAILCCAAAAICLAIYVGTGHGALLTAVVLLVAYAVFELRRATARHEAFWSPRRPDATPDAPPPARSRTDVGPTRPRNAAGRNGVTP